VAAPPERGSGASQGGHRSPGTERGGSAPSLAPMLGAGALAFSFLTTSSCAAGAAGAVAVAAAFSMAETDVALAPSSAPPATRVQAGGAATRITRSCAPPGTPDLALARAAAAPEADAADAADPFSAARGLSLCNAWGGVLLFVDFSAVASPTDPPTRASPTHPPPPRPSPKCKPGGGAVACELVLGRRLVWGSTGARQVELLSTG